MYGIIIQKDKHYAHKKLFYIFNLGEIVYMKRTLMQIYVKDSVKAAEFYQKAFDAPLLCGFKDEHGAYEHSELDIYGQILAISESRRDETSGNKMQFCLHFESGEKDKVTKAYEILAEDAEKIDCPLGVCSYSPHMASLIDKFGVYWCIFTD